MRTLKTILRRVESIQGTLGAGWPRLQYPTLLLGRGFLVSVGAFLFVVISACATKEARLHDQKLVAQLLQEHGSEADTCYQEEAARNREMPSGALKIRFDHDRQGRLSRPRLMDGFSYSEPVFQCIVQRSKAWQTSPPATIGPLDLTFQFRNEGRKWVKNEDFGYLMKTHRDEFADCFLKSRPHAKSAQIQFRFRQTPDGRVKDLEQVQGFDGSHKIFGCMKNIISNWTLPPRDSSLSAEWSYKFNLEDVKSSTESN